MLEATCFKKNPATNFRLIPHTRKAHVFAELPVQYYFFTHTKKFLKQIEYDMFKHISILGDEFLKCSYFICFRMAIYKSV